MKSMEAAINNMIDEIKKPVDPDINGSARKAELQSIKQTATDCKELIIERQRLEQMIKDLKTSGKIDEAKDAEEFELPHADVETGKKYKHIRDILDEYLEQNLPDLKEFEEELEKHKDKIVPGQIGES